MKKRITVGLVPLFVISSTLISVAPGASQSTPVATSASSPTQLLIEGRKTSWTIPDQSFGTSKKRVVAAQPCLRLNYATQRITVCVESASRVRVKHRGYKRSYKLKASLRKAGSGYKLKVATAGLMLRKGSADLITFCKGDTCSAPKVRVGVAKVPVRKLTACTARSPWFFKNRNTKSKVVSLTLDDGPSRYTNKALKILREAGVPATFFVVGVHARSNAKMLRKIRAQGHVLANHSYSHADLGKISSSSVSRELSRSSAIIRRATGFSPCAFRAPYGESPPSVINTARSQGLATVLWNAGAHDYLSLGSGRIASETLGNTRPGSIILLHDGGGNRSSTLAALPRIIKTLRDRGYRFENVPDLLRFKPSYQ